MPRSRKEAQEQRNVEDIQQQTAETQQAVICPECQKGLLQITMQSYKIKCPSCGYAKFSKTVEGIEKK